MNFRELTNSQLEYWYRLAQEMQDGRYLKAINEERNRRSREE